MNTDTDLNSLLETVELKLKKYRAMSQEEWQTLHKEDRGAELKMNEEFDCLLELRGTLIRYIAGLKKFEKSYN